MSINSSRLAQLIDLSPGEAEFRAAVMDALGRQPKWLPPKFFYDREGSRLFDAITELPEYYLTRTERALLDQVRGDIARIVGPGRAILEFGSGAGVKVRALLDALDHPAAYVPVDISRTHLIEAATSLANDYPTLTIAPICADYTKPFTLPPGLGADTQWLGFFPGSTIGNFTPPQDAAFLAQARRILGRSSFMLIGADRKKDRARLEAAYNDSAGVTAAFNLNLLRRINAELDGDFRLDRFAHRAVYDPDQGRMEMHLVSLEDQEVRIGDRMFFFKAGETIHTENSYKYDPSEIRRLAESAGWRLQADWTDNEALFGLYLLAAA